VNAIDPRNDLDLSTIPTAAATAETEGSGEVKNRTNSKFLDLDKLQQGR